ncbi:hypothetical protein Tsubulata_033379 [Turnera subulata]|uniref:Serine incorporator n=1 Tax=Turnera subulata TaxID=218843 RepID=A0A9Q0GCN9_9ROSI|nr:hypothetical protein Tsubulata_033379 [Turnera subulata]
MESSGNSRNERHAVVLKDPSWLGQFRNGSNPWVARYVYGLMFLVANLLAWAARDYGHAALSEMESKMPFLIALIPTSSSSSTTLAATYNLSLILDLGIDDKYWFCIICLLIRLVPLACDANRHLLNDSRDPWHSGWWTAKIAMWIGLTILSFLIPSAFIQIYGEIAHFGAGVFLLIQLISVISFIRWLNDCCHSEKYAERCHVHVMLIATVAYVVCLVGIILMYIWYAPESSCLLNIFFISWTLVLLQLMTSVSLHPKVNAGFLTPGLMGLYVVFLCCEPAGESCNRKAEASRKTDWLTIISFIVALLAIVIATFSTGIDSQCFQLQFRKRESRTEDDVPYGYGFFHFVFATGAMYFAMLLIGWNTHHAIAKWTIDVGWTSAWVRIVNEWLAVCVYLWMLVAPIILKNRQAAESTFDV